MTLPSSPPITLLQIQTEFGGPGNLLSYYAGGGHVGAGAANGTGVLIPSSGTITVEDFLGASAFTPFIDTFSTAGPVTITIPAGATTAFIEVWGASGGGGAGSGSGGSIEDGGGGASGAYCATSISVAGHSGLNFTANVGTLGAVGVAGTASNVATGSLAITTMNSGGGNHGGNSSIGTPGSGGGAGTASGGSVSNTNGNNGASGITTAGGAGVAGTNGTGANGGQGGAGAAQINRSAGGNGLIKVSWT
jgi:hypothetical protein